MKGRQNLHHYCSTCYICITKYLWEKSYRWKTSKKSDALKNSIFESYRAPALFNLETCDLQFINFVYHPWKFEKDILSRFGGDSVTKWHPQNQKIVNISDRKWRHHTKFFFDLSRPIYTIPENFMKIRPGVLEKSSTIQNNNNKEKRTEE